MINELVVGKRYRNTKTGRVFLVGDVNRWGGTGDAPADEDLTGRITVVHDQGRVELQWADLEEVQG